MKYQDVYRFVPPPAKPNPSEEARLAQLRATSSLCVENTAIWWQRHAWSIGGTCSRCGVQLRAAA